VDNEAARGPDRVGPRGERAMNDDKPQAQPDKSFSLTQRERAQEFGAAPPPDNKKPVDKNSPKCVACGRYHGGVNKRINCLESGIRERDQQIAALKAEVESRDVRLRLERGEMPTKVDIPPVEPKPESA